MMISDQNKTKQQCNSSTAASWLRLHGVQKSRGSGSCASSNGEGAAELRQADPVPDERGQAGPAS